MARHLSRAHRAAISAGLRAFWAGVRAAAARRSAAAAKGWQTRKAKAARRSIFANLGWITRRRRERKTLRRIGAARREAERQFNIPIISDVVSAVESVVSSVESIITGELPSEAPPPQEKVSLPLIVHATPAFVVWDDSENVQVAQDHLAMFYSLARGPGEVRFAGAGQVRHDTDIAFEEEAVFVFEPSPEWEVFKANYYEAVRQYIAAVKEEIYGVNDGTSEGFAIFVASLEITEL